MMQQNDPIERFVASRQQRRGKALFEQMHFMNSEMPIDVDYVYDNDITDPGRPSAPTEDELIADPQFQAAAKVVYDAFGGKGQAERQYGTLVGQEAPKSREDFAKWGMEFMGWFNYNLPQMGLISYQASQLPEGDMGRFALYELMELYDQKQVSWSGTRRFWRGVLTDPSTYVGLGTFGVGVAGRTGVKTATKAGVKEILKRSAGTAAALEAAAYGATDDIMRQKVKIGAGQQEELDFGQTAAAAATSALLGGSVVKGAQFLVDQLPTNRLMAKVYDGADEAQADLVNFLKEFSERPIETDDAVVLPENPPAVADPGLKQPETAKAKIKRKGYKSPEDLGDIVRAGIAVDRPDEAEALVKKIGETFEIADEGWTAYPGGYFDRKVVVTLPNGKKGELQIWSKEISDVKEKMHEVYTQAREVEKDPKQQDRYQNLLKESDAIASQALTAGAAVWQPIYDQIGLSVPGL